MSFQVGKHLAEVLLKREHGRRPVTLIGYSLGARVIYYCLRVSNSDANPSYAGLGVSISTGDILEETKVVTNLL